MRKRDEADADGTRLAYSTGGEPAKPAEPPKPKSPLKAAPGKGIRVRLERRPGGRDITTVLGLVGRPDQLAILAAELRAACGAGGTVRDGVVELQGDQRDKVKAALLERGLKSSG
jgi:translation initiation factor 1